MPAMKGVFRRALDLRKSVNGRFRLPRACVSTFPGFPGYCHKYTDKCGTAKHNPKLFGPGKVCVQPYDDMCVPVGQGPGLENTDFVLYVTAKHDAGCAGHSETVASAGFCTHDYDNWYGLQNRPLAGVANFCPGNIYTEESKFGYMLDTAVHEVLHALVMNKELFGMFIDRNGKPLKAAVTQSDRSLVVRTPTVTRVAREMLGCPQLKGAKLEDEGGFGTAESHWERRLFLGELMIGSSSISSRVVLSNLTLALLEDSGWYKAKFGDCGILSIIQHRGCGFVNSDCHRYNKALEETFCWNDKPARQQSSICTPDHMAIGYCKNDISLVGDCNIIQPFKNTHCTNKAHQSASKHVDLGMRHKPGARCFPVDSYKITRTENYYTVFKSDLGAACFDVVCKGKDLYIRIPSTEVHKGKDIRCPTGKMIDLTAQGLGFDEGKIGPCPKNDLVCESWGCPDDCSGHGGCFDGKCYCDLGYVGENCEGFACPHRKCKSDEVCHEDSGICRRKGFSAETKKKPIKTSAPTTISTKTPKPPPKKERLPSHFPSLEEHGSSVGWAPKPGKVEKRPPPQKTKKPSGFSESIEGFGSVPTRSSPRKPPGPGEKTLSVLSTKPKKVPTKARPGAQPPKKPEPKFSSPSAYTVPAYKPLRPSTGEPVPSGRVVAVGYLRGCLLFADTKGYLRVGPKTVKQYTKDYGEWSLDVSPKKGMLVVDPAYGDCIDLFTNLPPLWRLQGFKTVRTLSGISTLAALAPGGRSSNEMMDNETDVSRRRLESYTEDPYLEDPSMEETQNEQQTNKETSYAMERGILKALGLKDKYILQRDFVTETYTSGDKEAKRAVVYNAMVSNTVIQISCFMDRSTEPSYRTSDFLFRVLGHYLKSGVSLDKLVYVDTVYLLVEEFKSGTAENDKSSWLLSEAVARTNKLAYEHLSRYSGLKLLKAVARLTITAQKKLCPMAANLKSGDMHWTEYSDQTSKYNLKEMVDSTRIPDIDSVMKKGHLIQNDGHDMQSHSDFYQD